MMRECNPSAPRPSDTPVTMVISGLIWSPCSRSTIEISRLITITWRSLQSLIKFNFLPVKSISQTSICAWNWYIFLLVLTLHVKKLWYFARPRQHDKLSWQLALYISYLFNLLLWAEAILKFVSTNLSPPSPIPKYVYGKWGYMSNWHK